MSKGSLVARKQQLVRNAIRDAAIELFAANGFEETTVEEVAVAAGVSRRSFFRYFASKDDLLAQSLVADAIELSERIATSKSGDSPIEVVREAVLAATTQIKSEAQLRQIIQIALRSMEARRAFLSRMIETEDMIAEAFARRLNYASGAEATPRLLAVLTILIRNVSTLAWYKGEQPNLAAAAEQTLAQLTHLFCNFAP